MRILFDKRAPYGLARYLEGHVIATAEERGWGPLENGVVSSSDEAPVTIAKFLSDLRPGCIDPAVL